MDAMQDESKSLSVESERDKREEQMGTVTNGDVSASTIIDLNVNMNDFVDVGQQVNRDHNNDDNERNCLMRLVFRDEMAFNELHQVIGQCVRDALFLMKKSTNLIIDKSENCVKIKEITVDNDESIFMVDTLPTDNTNKSEIPNYNSSTIDVLNNDIDSNEVDDNKPKTGNCWNCGGDHNMKDCTEKRDPEAISRAKQAFMQKPKTERYHLDNEQKYSHIVPGKLSDNLRQALGLRSRELPMYIYKMRLYGYPEGWLEEAKINHSGLSLFHTENKINDDGDDNGEIEKVEYDANKFIEFPGFNAPVPSNLIDDGDYYRVPPMLFANSKEGLIQSLHNNLAKTYKRKRLKIDDGEKSTTQNVKDDDMDIAENSEDECSNSPAPVLFPQPRPDTDETSSNTIPDVEQETSLLELERRQYELRRALEEEVGSSDSNSLPSSSQNNDDIIADIENDGKTNSKIDTEIIDTISTENVNVQTDNECFQNIAIIVEKNENIKTEVRMEQTGLHATTLTPSIAGRSRESVFGTPLIQQVSPYTKLPIGDNWSVGVSDVIDFDNLPNSTGTYEKLTGVIKKVRTVIKRINDETEHDSS